MIRIISIFGSIGGMVLVASFFIGLMLGMGHDDHNIFVGYLIMLVALSFVFVGVKKYRDQELGGIIRFGTATKVGAGIAVVAAIFYVLGWELYMYVTDYSFMPSYIESVAAAEKAKGTSPEQIAKMLGELRDFARQYENPLFRMAITFSEIAPVCLLVTLVSAALLRKPGFLPARARA